jgi:hypothetical protein
MKRLSFLAVVLAGLPAFGQAVSTRPASGGAASRPATTTRAATTSRPASVAAPATAAKNIDKALDGLITVDVQEIPFGKLTDVLRERTQANIAVNWNAFALAGVTRETPVTLHLRDISFEQVLRALMEALPTTGTQANYTVGGNTVAITTNSELSTLVSSKLYDTTRAISYSFTTPVKGEEMVRNAAVFDAVIRAELARAGDPADAKEHSLAIKDNILVATVSERGQEFINRALNMFNQPLKVGQLAKGTQFTSDAKKATDAYKAFLASPAAVAPAVLAKEPAKYRQFNTALLPGAAAELAKEKPDIGVAINDGGVLLLGPKAAIRARTVLAIYDLRDVMKKLTAKTKITPVPPQADFQFAITQVLQTSIVPEGDMWGTGEDLGKKPAVMIPYNGLLIVFATAETQRTVAGALQDMNK